jgi:succinoglycan biosynthesis transport protein ExoP
MRGLKTSVDLVTHDQSLNCLAVTSLYPGEGKSTIASNLATLFAASGTRTLLIDGSPDESTGARNPATDVSEGLFDILFGAATLDKVKISSASLPLDRLSGGGRQSAPISSGLMGSDAMKQFLEQARKEYEMIIVDLPSMKTAADARAISPFVDAMIVVARSGGTPVEILSEALQELHSARAMILGVVLNKVNVRILRKHGNLAAAYCA